MIMILSIIFFPSTLKSIALGCGQMFRAPSSDSGSPRSVKHRQPSPTVETWLDGQVRADEFSSLQAAHRIALDRVVFLEKQLKEKSDQLVAHQAKAQQSKQKVLDLSIAIQSLRSKVGCKPNATRVAATQTDDDWERDWQERNVMQAAEIEQLQLDGAQWRSKALSLESSTSLLQQRVTTLEADRRRCGSRATSLQQWAAGLMHQCQRARYASDGDPLAALTLSDIDALDASSLTYAVAHVVGSLDCTDLHLVTDPGLESNLSPQGNSVATPAALQEPSLIPHDSSTAARSPRFQRSLLEELALSSSSIARGTSITPSQRGDHGSDFHAKMAAGSSAHSDNVRSIEMRLDVLHRALENKDLPMSLRTGMEADVHMLRQQLDDLTVTSAAALRLASQRVNPPLNTHSLLPVSKHTVSHAHVLRDASPAPRAPAGGAQYVTGRTEFVMRSQSGE